MGRAVRRPRARRSAANVSVPLGRCGPCCSMLPMGSTASAATRRRPRLPRDWSVSARSYLTEASPLLDHRLAQRLAAQQPGGLVSALRRMSASDSSVYQAMCGVSNRRSTRSRRSHVDGLGREHVQCRRAGRSPRDRTQCIADHERPREVLTSTRSRFHSDPVRHRLSKVVARIPGHAQHDVAALQRARHRTQPTRRPRPGHLGVLVVSAHVSRATGTRHLPADAAVADDACA
jgi:hypothetical protein